MPKDYSHGSEVIINTTEDSADITDLELVDPEGVELVGAFGVELGEDQGTSGTLYGWPPRNVDAELNPLSKIGPNSRTNIILHVRSVDGFDEGSFDGFKMSYESDGLSHNVTSRMAIQLGGPC